MTFCIGFLNDNPFPVRFTQVGFEQSLGYFSDENTVFELKREGGKLVVTNFRGPIKKKRPLNAKPILPLETTINISSTTLTDNVAQCHDDGIPF